MPKPTPSDCEIVARCAVRGLPDNITDRRAALAALVAILPESPARDQVLMLREHLIAHERHQLKFLGLLAAGGIQ